MHKMTKAYLFEEGTVVLDKSVIHNSKNENYREVTLIISTDQIKDLYEEIEMLGLDDDD